MRFLGRLLIQFLPLYLKLPVYHGDNHPIHHWLAEFLDEIQDQGWLTGPVNMQESGERFQSS